MLNVATSKKNKNHAYLQLVKKIARETRVETLARLHASAEGLSTRQADLNREEYGSNKINTNQNDSKIHSMINAVLTPFTIVLLILALILLATDILPSKQNNLVTATIILIIVLIASVIRFVQNLNTSAAFENMLQMVSVTTNIKRDNENQELPTDQVVVGDVINLAAGDMVPADMRLLRSKDLFCTTSSINDDFTPKEKISNKIPQFNKIEDYLDIPNILYQGTTIVSGSGAGVVFATGEHTAYGAQVQAANRKQIRKNTFGVGIHSITKLLIWLMIIFGGLIFVLNGIFKQNWLEALVFASAVIVGLTPEMLPTIVSSNLVRGSKEMAKQDVIIKKLSSIQNLGASDVLCIDKTGILTQDKVMLERHYDLAIRENRRVLQLAYLNAYYQTGMTDLIDEAILDAAGSELDVDDIHRDYNKIDEIPFDYNRRRMSVVVANSDQNHGEHLLVTKGAAAEMLAAATKMELNDEILPLTAKRKAKILKQVETLSDDGLRILLLGYKKNPAPVGEFSVKDETDLTLVGFLTFLDPPKESARATLAKLANDGVSVKILTGDNEEVTRTLGLQVGLNVDTVYRVADLENKTPQELSKMVDECHIFVELTPEWKTKIIEILRQNGHIVSFVGDKINDEAAMKSADVAISVDNAVDIAKETANVILLHKDLILLERAIRVSRNVFGNIIKYFKIILTTDFGNALAIVFASILLPFLPFLPLQLVLLNLIFNISCLAIPFDRMSFDYLKSPRVWKIKKIPNFMFAFGPIIAIVNTLACAGLFFIICPHLVSGNYYALSPAKQLIFSTTFYSGYFISCLWIQEMTIYVLRSRKLFLISQRASWGVIVTSLMAAIIGSLLPYSSIANLLNFNKMPFSYMWLILPLVLIYFLLVSIVKHFYLKKEKFLI